MCSWIVQFPRAVPGTRHDFSGCIGDHGSYRHGKATLYDFGMRVPMLLQWKGRIKPGSTYDGLVANIVYGLATIGTILAAWYLVAIG